MADLFVLLFLLHANDPAGVTISQRVITSKAPREADPLFRSFQDGHAYTCNLQMHSSQGQAGLPNFLGGTHTGQITASIMLIIQLHSPHGKQQHFIPVAERSPNNPAYLACFEDCYSIGVVLTRIAYPQNHVSYHSMAIYDLKP